LLIHGGVGTILKEKITPARENDYLQTLERAVLAGEEILKANGTAVEAVEASVLVMEDSPLFNAGKGSVSRTIPFPRPGSNKNLSIRLII